MGVSFLVRIGTRTHLNTARMSTAGDGWTELFYKFIVPCHPKEYGRKFLNFR